MHKLKNSIEDFNGVFVLFNLRTNLFAKQFD